jgi:hypothetical protein
MSEQLNLFKGDTLSTVLLIAVVFFVFYYLTKPKSDRECFAHRNPWVEAAQREEILAKKQLQDMMKFNQANIAREQEHIRKTNQINQQAIEARKVTEAREKAAAALEAKKQREKDERERREYVAKLKSAPKRKR